MPKFYRLGLCMCARARVCEVNPHFGAISDLRLLKWDSELQINLIYDDQYNINIHINVHNTFTANHITGHIHECTCTSHQHLLMFINVNSFMSDLRYSWKVLSVFVLGLQNVICSQRVRRADYQYSYQPPLKVITLCFWHKTKHMIWVHMMATTTNNCATRKWIILNTIKTDNESCVKQVRYPSDLTLYT